MSGRLGRGFGLSVLHSLRKCATRRSARGSGLVALLPCRGVTASTREGIPTWLKQASSCRTTSCCKDSKGRSALHSLLALLSSATLMSVKELITNQLTSTYDCAVCRANLLELQHAEMRMMVFA